MVLYLEVLLHGRHLQFENMVWTDSSGTIYNNPRFHIPRKWIEFDEKFWYNHDIKPYFWDDICSKKDAIEVCSSFRSAFPQTCFFGNFVQWLEYWIEIENTTFITNY